MPILFIAACRTDEPIPPATAPPEPTTATLRMHVVPEWDNAPFALFTEYRAPYDLRFQVEMLRLYLSDLRLVNDAGEEVVSDVELLDLGDGAYNLDLKVPAGTWYGMRAGLGLPPALNHSDPALYAQDHPLSVSTGMTWTWEEGRKFIILDGRYDPDPLGTGVLQDGFSVHTGRDTCYTQMELFPALPFRTAVDSVAELTLRIDVSGFLGTAQDTVHVAVENQSHGDNVPLALKITRNAARSFHLE